MTSIRDCISLRVGSLLGRSGHQLEVCQLYLDGINLKLRNRRAREKDSNSRTKRVGNKFT